MQALMQSGDVVTQIVSTLREDGMNWESSSEGITAVGLLASWGPSTGVPLVAAGAARECVLAVSRALFVQSQAAGDPASRCAQARRCAAVLLPTLLRLAKADPRGCTAQFAEGPVARALVYLLRAVTTLPIEGAPQAQAQAQAGAAAPAAAADAAAAGRADALGAADIDMKLEVEVDGDGDGDDAAAANWAGVSMYRLDLDARQLVRALVRGAEPETEEGAAAPAESADAAAPSTSTSSVGAADAVEAGSGTAAAASSASPQAAHLRRWSFAPGVYDVPPHMQPLLEAMMAVGAGRAIASTLRALKPGPSRSWRATHGVFEAALTLLRARPDFAGLLVASGVGERALAVLQSMRMVGQRRDGSKAEVKPAAVVEALAAKAGAGAGAAPADAIRLQSASALRRARTVIRSDPPVILLMDVAHLFAELAQAEEAPVAAAPAPAAGASAAYGDAAVAGSGPRGSRQLAALLRAATGSAAGPLHTPWLPFRIANVFAHPSGVHAHVAVALLRLLHLLAARGDAATRRNALKIFRNTTAPAGATVSRKYYLPLPDASLPAGDVKRGRREGRAAAAYVRLPGADLDPEAEGVQLFATNGADLAVTLASIGKGKAARAKATADAAAGAGAAPAEGEGQAAEAESAAGADAASAGSSASASASARKFLFNAREGPLALGMPPARPLLNMLHALSAADARAAAQRRRVVAEVRAEQAAASFVLGADKSVADLNPLSGFGLGLDVDASVPGVADAAASAAASSGSSPAAPLA